MSLPIREHVSIWPFHDSPSGYRKGLRPMQSGRGLWLAYVPSSVRVEDLEWLGEGTPFAPGERLTREVRGGTVVVGLRA